MALAVEECVALAAIVTAIDPLCFGGFRHPADDPPKPWRRWVCLLGTTGFPVGLPGLVFSNILGILLQDRLSAVPSDDEKLACFLHLLMV